MRHRRRPAASALATVLVAALAALVTGCTGSPTAPAAKPSATPSAATQAAEHLDPPAPPQLGQCRRLTWAQATATTASVAAVACRTPHTAETYAVGQLPVLQQGHRLSVDSPAVTARVAEVCPRRLSRSFRVTNQDLRLLSVKPVWFVPSPREAEAGATWFRCDALVIAGHQRLARLTGSLKARLADPEGRRDLGLCSTAAPGAAGFVRVPCAQPHRWRAIATVDLSGDDYPKGPGVLASSCRDEARSRAANTLDFRWSQELPTRAQWEAGQRYGVCWIPD